MKEWLNSIDWVIWARVVIVVLGPVLFAIIRLLVIR